MSLRAVVLSCFLPLVAAFQPTNPTSMALHRSGLFASRVSMLARQRLSGLRMSGGGPPKATPGKSQFYVKQGKEPGTLGDCPHCHKANMALRMKDVPIELVYINLADKPKWYFDLNEKGTVPTLITSEDGAVLPDSDLVVKFADDFPPKVHTGSGKLMGLPGSEEALALVTPLWGKVAGLLKNKDTALEAGLIEELHTVMKSIEGYLKSKSTPFLLGSEVTHADCKLAPFLLHAKVALPHYKKLDLLASYPATKEYFERISHTDAFKMSAYSDDTIIWGWSKFF